MRTLILLIFTIHFIYTTNAILCGQSQCPAGNACCNDYATGYRCYDRASYHCVANDMNQTVLCASKQKACGTACYNPAMYDCTDDEVLCGTTSRGQVIKSCAGQCYNPRNYGCCQGKLVAPGTATKCSPVPANDTTLFCSPFNQVPCTPGQWCCDGSCYDPTAQVCFDDQLCPIGNKVCGGSCYNTATQECCNSQIFAINTSICSTAPDATCCSCSCKSTIVSGFSANFTVSAHGQCNPTYIKSHFGSKLSCPSDTYNSCASSSNSCASTINCGTNNVFFSHCYDGYNTTSCSGNYLCGGGDYNCNIQSRSSCPAPVSNSYESGHNKTLTSPGSTSYENVPPAYAGKVCCWCSTPDAPVATSSPVPSVNDCNPAYMAANDYFNYPNTSCRVWSRDLFETPQRLACGLPNE